MWSTNACPIFTRVQSKGRFARHPQLNQARADIMQSRTYCSTCKVPCFSSYISTMHTILYIPFMFILFEVHTYLIAQSIKKNSSLENTGGGRQGHDRATTVANTKSGRVGYTKCIFSHPHKKISNSLQ